MWYSLFGSEGVLIAEVDVGDITLVCIVCPSRYLSGRLVLAGGEGLQSKQDGFHSRFSFFWDDKKRHRSAGEGF